VDATPPSQLRFRLLGEATLRIAGVDNHRVLPQKGLALLIYLAMNRGRSVSRSALADLLWGDRVDSQARQNLRQCILTLRRDLGPLLAGILIVDDQSLALAADGVEVDALQFVACASAADSTDRQRCIDLPWGAFLGHFTTGAGGFDEWAVAARQELDATAARVFAELAEQFEAVGDAGRAIAALERLILIDPAEEHRHRRLLTLEARTRGADAALVRGKTLIALLKREFDAEPEPATLALLEEFRCHARTDSSDARQITTEPSDDQIRIEPAAATPPAPATSKRIPRAIAACAVASLAITGGVLAGMRSSSPPASIVERGRQQDLATQAPRATGPGESLQASATWRSPPLSSRPADEAAFGRERGLVAIAVLPFASRGEQTGALIADMMTDDLNDMLSRFGEFRVISDQTTRSYQGQNANAAAIGMELGVRYLLEGKVVMRGDHLRVNAGLVDTVSQLQVWSRRYDRSGADRRAIQDEIVNSLARELQIEVIQLESERATTDPNVHELTFKGWAAIGAASRSGVEGLRQAERFFLQALSRDPDNARAQAGLAAYHIRMVVQLHTDEPATHLETAETILQRLIDRHPNIQGPYLDLGLVYVARGQNKKAARLFERSIELNPSHAPSHAQLGLALVRMGQPNEGREHILYAMRLSPRDPTLPYWLTFVGRAELELCNYDKAIAYIERSLALNPDYPPGQLVLVAAYAQSENMSAAHRQLEQLSQTRPHLSREKLIERFGEVGGLRQSQLVLGLRRALAPMPHGELAAQAKLEKPQTVSPFDGIWRVEFSNNEFCSEKGSTALWSIREGVLKGGEIAGTVSSKGELRATWPALFDLNLMNVGSAKLEGVRGEGKWDGQRHCGGAFTLMRVSGP